MTTEWKTAISNRNDDTVVHHDINILCANDEGDNDVEQYRDYILKNVSLQNYKQWPNKSWIGSALKRKKLSANRPEFEAHYGEDLAGVIMKPVKPVNQSKIKPRKHITNVL